MAGAKKKNRGRGQSHAWSPCVQHEWTMEKIDEIWCMREACLVMIEGYSTEYAFAQHCLLEHHLPTTSCRATAPPPPPPPPHPEDIGL